MQGQANHFFRYAPEKIPYGKHIDGLVSRAELDHYVKLLMSNVAMYISQIEADRTK